ncbi:MAG: hypothetical protein IT204_07630 [Fimbriimonadaceae bacterium]|nr:hypothetical protein [Fimbriimonadaceae bacterium]
MARGGDWAIRERIERRLVRRRRLRLLAWFVVLAGSAAFGAERWLTAQRVFVVKVIRLPHCPDHLRPPAAKVLEPLLGRTVFEVRAQAGTLCERLSALPEVAGAELVCRPPDSVEVALTPRQPRFAVHARGAWLSVAADGVVVRAPRQAEPGLTRIYGLQPPAAQPGTRLKPSLLAGAERCADACRAVLGRPPQQVAFDPGGGVRVRTADGQLVLLGRPVELEPKLRLYRAVRGQLRGPVEYVDVAVPESPAWLPRKVLPLPTAKETADAPVRPREERLSPSPPAAG